MDGTEVACFRTGKKGLAESIREREREGEGLGLAARWMVEQYLAIVELANRRDKPDAQIVSMILHDDDVRRLRIKE